MEKEEEKDPLREGPLRLLGYANEVGEALRPVARALVVPSYCVAFGYVIADTAHKAMMHEDLHKRKMAAVDALAWQTLASVLLPGLCINRVVWGTQRILAPVAARNVLAARWVPVLTGLAAIPFIVEPIDEGVHWLMDSTMRKWIGHSSTKQ